MLCKTQCLHPNRLILHRKSLLKLPRKDNDYQRSITDLELFSKVVLVRSRFRFQKPLSDTFLSDVHYKGM
jgi:hypothetical protein